MNRKTILWAVGAIVMGALGSALWELIKPLLSLTWTFFLNLATFGLGTLRDNLYTSAASNPWRSTGFGSAFQLLAASVFLCSGAILFYILSLLGDRLPNRGRMLMIPLKMLPLVFLFGGSLIMARAIQAKYVEQLASYYVKLEIIAAPFISDKEMKSLHSKYVQITGRRQYLDQVEKLQRIILENGIQPPTRDFF